MVSTRRPRRTEARDGEMVDMSGPRGRVTDEQVQEVLSWLHPPLLTALKNLADAPPSIVDAAIQLLPVASRIVLRQQGMATYVDDATEQYPGHQRALKLTPLGVAVIGAAAVELTSVADWEKRAKAAVAAFNRAPA